MADLRNMHNSFFTTFLNTYGKAYADVQWLNPSMKDKGMLSKYDLFSPAILCNCSSHLQSNLL